MPHSGPIPSCFQPFFSAWTYQLSGEQLCSESHVLFTLSTNIYESQLRLSRESTFLTLVCVKPHPGFHSWKKHCHISYNNLTSCSRDILVPPCPKKLCLLSGWKCMGTHDCSRPSSPVYGIFQGRIQKRVAISFPRGSYWSRMETGSLASHAMASRFFTTEPDGKPSLSVVSAVKNLLRLLSRQKQQKYLFSKW